MKAITSFDCKVRSVTRIDRQKEDADLKFVRIACRDEEGEKKANLELPESYGIRAGATIKVSVENPQTSLKEFKGKKAKKEEGASDEKF